MYLHAKKKQDWLDHIRMIAAKINMIAINHYNDLVL